MPDHAAFATTLKIETFQAGKSYSDAEELLMMQRFAAGNLLHLLDGPFNRADTLKNLLIEGGTFADFNQLVQAIRKLTAGDVQELANKWLDPELLVEVVIG